MEINSIQELANIVDVHGLTVLEITENGTMIRLEKKPYQVGARSSMVSTSPAANGEGPLTALTPTPDVPLVSDGNQTVDFNKLFLVTAPMVGLFYAAPSPDAEPFVSIGSNVKKGDTLCIIESMKLMNEITAEQDGQIVDICIKDGDIAEFGQILFKLF